MSKNTNRGAFAPLSVSQNFLTSARLIRRLLAYTDIRENDLVYEIGPGKGHITGELLKTGAQVRAIELDSRLFARLLESFAGESRLSLRQGDFLRCPLPKTGSYKVFSNIPFSRTTDIVRKLTQAPNPPDAAWLIVEEGAAKRFCSAFPKRGQTRTDRRDAASGKAVFSRKSLSSLSLRPFFEVSILCRLDRANFHPAPSVDCALLCIRRKEQPDLPLADRAAYRRFLERAWKQGVRSVLTKRQIATALRTADLPSGCKTDGTPPVSDKNLLYVQWLCLFRSFQTVNHPQKPGPFR